MNEIMNMPTVALVSIFAEFKGAEQSDVAPSGLLYIGGALKAVCYNVKLYHISYWQIDETVENIVKEATLFVGLSVFTGLPASHSAEFSKKLKSRNADIKVVWGGVHPSLTPEQCLQQWYIDMVVIGEGEETVVELADALVKGGGLESIRGLAYKDEGRIIINEDRPHIADLDRYRRDWSLVNVDKYIKRTVDGRRIFTFISSRGCPYNCGFCYNTKFNRRRWRAHSTDFVLQELGALQSKCNFTHLLCNDDNFFSNKQRALELIKQFYKIGTRLVHADIRIDAIDHSLLQQLSKYEVEHIFIGWESGNDRILKLINKGFTIDQLLEKIRLLAQYPHINVKASAIIGFPTETKEEIWHTVSVMLKMAKIHPNICFNLGTYLPYPGTPLYSLAIQEGFVPPNAPEGWKEWDVFSQCLHITWLPWLSRKDTLDIRNLNRYCQIFESAPKLKEESFIKYFMKNMFRKIARFRIRQRFFYFPIEFTILSVLRKLSNFIRWRYNHVT